MKTKSFKNSVRVSEVPGLVGCFYFQHGHVLPLDCLSVRKSSVLLPFVARLGLFIWLEWSFRHGRRFKVVFTKPSRLFFHLLLNWPLPSSPSPHTHVTPWFTQWNNLITSLPFTPNTDSFPPRPHRQQSTSHSLSTYSFLFFTTSLGEFRVDLPGYGCSCHKSSGVHWKLFPQNIQDWRGNDHCWRSEDFWSGFGWRFLQTHPFPPPPFLRAGSGPFTRWKHAEGKLWTACNTRTYAFQQSLKKWSLAPDFRAFSLALRSFELIPKVWTSGLIAAISL